MSLKSFIMLDALAVLTSLDDRDALLISLGISLQEIFDLERVDFYHCRAIPEQEQEQEQEQTEWQIKKTMSLAHRQITQEHQWNKKTPSTAIQPILTPSLKTRSRIYIRLLRTNIASSVALKLTTTPMS